MILSHEEAVQRVREIIEKSPEADTAFEADMTETLNDVFSRSASSELEQRYNELREQYRRNNDDWARRYAERFNGGSPDNTKKDGDNEDEEEELKNLKIDDLFGASK